MKAIINTIFVCGFIIAVSSVATGGFVGSETEILLTADGEGTSMTDEKSDLSVQLDQESEDLVSEEETYDLDEEMVSRLNELEEKNSVMHDQVVKLSERLGLVEKNVSVLEESEQKSKWCFYGKVREHLDLMRVRLGPRLYMITLSSIILAFLALLMYLIVPSRKSRNVCCAKGSDVGKEQDVDDPEEVESDSSKLNLARAYIEMGEGEKAKSMLMGVLLHGNDDEQAEAKGLLDKIKHGEDV